MANRNVLRLPLHQRVTLLDMRRIRTLALAAYVCLATVPSIYSQTMQAPDIADGRKRSTLCRMRTSTRSGAGSFRNRSASTC